MSSKQYISPGTLSRSPITQAIQFSTVVRPTQRSVSRYISLLNMSSRDLAHCLGETRGGRIAKPEHQEMIAQLSLPNKDNFLCGAAAISFGDPVRPVMDCIE